MEKDNQEQKNKCKLCSKVFPCGRSLGGHMRSHVIMKSNSNYGDNPKKTNRFENSSKESQKLCKECGKAFPSWKSLFGHMKCHSEKVPNYSLAEENDFSWDSAHQKLVMDSQSDNEFENPIEKRSNTRRIRHEVGSANGSTSSLSTASEIEQEQAEEVAICLMMLSKDVKHNWAGLYSVSGYSDNNSVFSEPQSSICADKTKLNSVNSISDQNEMVKKLIKLKVGNAEYKNLNSGISQLDGKRSEPRAYGISRKGLKMKKLEDPFDGFSGEDKSSMFKLDEGQRTESFEDKLSNFQSQFGNNKHKRKFSDSYDSELAINSAKKKSFDAMGSEFCKISNKRNIFECISCNKVFYSYQALGGHRAAHKRMKGCFPSNIDQLCESRTEGLIDHGVSKKQEVRNGFKKDKRRGHECPICFKVFSSGQALGGHKRSHLVLGGDGSDGIIPTNSQTISAEKPESDTRDFLDLNLPAPIDEEITSHGEFNSKPWWVVGGSHSREPLVGSIYN